MHELRQYPGTVDKEVGIVILVGSSAVAVTSLVFRRVPCSWKSPVTGVHTGNGVYKKAACGHCISKLEVLPTRLENLASADALH